MTRTRYLTNTLGKPPQEIKTGAKGTDLFTEIPSQSGATKKISIAEAQILQMILEAKQNAFGRVIFHDIVGSETQLSIEELWKKPSFLDPTKTYEQYVADSKNIEHWSKSFQSYVPTLDISGKLSVKRTAPAGHGSPSRASLD